MPSGIYKHKKNQGFQRGNTVWLGKKLSESHKQKLRKPKSCPSHFKGRSYKDIYGKDWKRQIERRRMSRIAHHDKIGRSTDFHRPKHHGYSYNHFVRKVFERDDFTCCLCGIRGGKLHADHYPKSFASIVKIHKIKTMKEATRCNELWDINNGRTVCVDCHKKTYTYGKHLKDEMQLKYLRKVNTMKNNDLVWHNEQHQSWTYCGTFLTIKTTSDTFQLYRDNQESFVLALIGTFPNRDVAMAIAQMIKTSESDPLIGVLNKEN